MVYTVTGLVLSRDASGSFNEVLIIERLFKYRKVHHFRIKRAYSRIQLLQKCAEYLNCLFSDIDVSSNVNLDILKYII